MGCSNSSTKETSNAKCTKNPEKENPEEKRIKLLEDINYFKYE